MYGLRARRFGPDRRRELGHFLFVVTIVVCYCVAVFPAPREALLEFSRAFRKFSWLAQGFGHPTNINSWAEAGTFFWKLVEMFLHFVWFLGLDGWSCICMLDRWPEIRWLAFQYYVLCIWAWKMASRAWELIFRRTYLNNIMLLRSW